MQILRMAAYALLAVAAIPAASLDVVYVARHAQKSAEAFWGEHGRLRPLSEKGAQCTARLAGELADAEITAVYSSETTRTLSTGAAISGALEAVIVGDDATARAPKTFASRARADHGDNKAILVVGHSNTVGAVVTAFQPDAASCLEKLGFRADGTVDESRYGDLWRVDLDAPACEGGVVRTAIGHAGDLDCMTP